MFPLYIFLVFQTYENISKTCGNSTGCEKHGKLKKPIFAFIWKTRNTISNHSTKLDASISTALTDGTKRGKRVTVFSYYESNQSLVQNRNANIFPPLVGCNTASLRLSVLLNASHAAHHEPWAGLRAQPSDRETKPLPPSLPSPSPQFSRKLP